MNSLFKSKPKTPADLVRQTRDLLVSLDLSGTEGKESRREKQVLYGNGESEPVAEACAQFTSECFRELAQMACLINNNMGVLLSATNRGRFFRQELVALIMSCVLWDLRVRVRITKRDGISKRIQVKAQLEKQESNAPDH